MKNLKRVLALVLVVTLVFSLSVSALAFTDDAAITHDQAVLVLSELGVIKGYPDGSYRPNDPVTRAEMAKMITVILNKGVDDPSQFESGTTDLTDISWNWGKSYITYCYILNIIAGYGDGTFRPEDNVTVQEAAKMILVALGFDVTQEGLEGINWAVNANARANQYDIYTGVTQSVNEAATRDTIAQMLYNMLKTNTVHYDVNIYTGISTLQKDEKALSKYFDCELLNGVVVANEYAALWGGVPLMAGRTEVLFYDEDATANGMFDIADASYTNGVFNNWITDILKVSTTKDQLGMWVSLIRNKTTKNVIGEVMQNDHLMTVVNGGDGNFLDAIKNAGLRLSDGRYSLFVNGEVLRWETTSTYLPSYINHPLDATTYVTGYNSSNVANAWNYNINANLGVDIFNVFGTEYKDMNGMTFYAVELNGDNYIDAIFVETDTLTQVKKVETKGGAKEYTFYDLNLSYTGPSAGDRTDIDNYTAQSVKAADIVTDDTLEVDDYVLVKQVNETYYISKVEFDDLTVSSKSPSAKTITLKDKDNATTTYNLSHIPVANELYESDKVLTNAKDDSYPVLNTIVGNKYTFGFDSAGNVVMAKALSEKTTYALMNGMATTYGTNYTAQLLLSDGTTIEAGVNNFTGFGNTPSAYVTNGSNSASANPVLVSYKQDGDKYNLTYVQTDTEASMGYTKDSSSSMTINGTSYRMTGDTVLFYRTYNSSTQKYSYTVYEDFTKAPTFTGASVYVAAVEGVAKAIFVKDGTVLEESKNYIYVGQVLGNYYDTTPKYTEVSGLAIDKDGNVTVVDSLKLEGGNAASQGQLINYVNSTYADVYKVDATMSSYRVLRISQGLIYLSSDGTTVAKTLSYSDSKTKIYEAKNPNPGYDPITNTSNFSKLNVGDNVLALSTTGDVATLIMRTGYTANTYTYTETLKTYSAFAYNSAGTLYRTSYNATTGVLNTTGVVALSTNANIDSDGNASSGYYTTTEAAAVTLASAGDYNFYDFTEERITTTVVASDGTVTTTVHGDVSVAVATTPTPATSLTNLTLGAYNSALTTSSNSGTTANDYNITSTGLILDNGSSAGVTVYSTSAGVGYMISGSMISTLATNVTTDAMDGAEFYYAGSQVTAPTDTTTTGAYSYSYALVIK